MKKKSKKISIENKKENHIPIEIDGSMKMVGLNLI